MKKSKKKLLIITIIVSVLLICLFTYFVAFHSNNDNTLTLEENKWIESNKYNVIDVALMNDIPILSYDGSGLIYDYLNYVTDKLSLKFNIITYKLDNTVEYPYRLEIKDNIEDNDIVLLEDNFVLVTNNNNEYKKIEDIDNLKIGILASDREKFNKYFNGKNVEFIEYQTYEELKNSIIDSKTDLQQDIDTTTIDGIIILKTIFTKEIIENDYNISFQFNDVNKYFILKINESPELNSILYKNYNIWKEKNYSSNYNKNLLENYFKFKNISDSEQKRLKSKSYIYGFIDYGIYNTLEDNKISGLNGLILNGFNDFSDISITYTRYNSINNLIKDFNDNKVDFILNLSDEAEYNNKVYNTVGIFNKDLVIISGINNSYVIDNINSLVGKEVLTIKNSYLEKYLTDNGIKVKSYNNMTDLTKDYGINDITILDMENYNFYKTSIFKDSKINYLLDTPGKYNYIINDNEDNDIFKNLFNFYLSFTSVNKLVTTNYNSIAYENSNIEYILIIIILVLCFYVVIDFSNHMRLMLSTIKTNKKIKLSKEDKIKYIDQLTSLKNRAYLNSKIESWDESEVYPQCIIIIDLNNISYINDNYGREEGDKVITEAANILIQHQLHNSEIIRTDGNEFLIYLVGYNEKQVISYLRKLNKELKTLSHGFGAASGYSIITDAIKTVDDAVNEATIDMKNNKEDINY